MKARSILLCGAPSAAKETQVERLGEEYGIPQIPTGDVLQETAAGGTPVVDRVAKRIEGALGG